MTKGSIAGSSGTSLLFLVVQLLIASLASANLTSDAQVAFSKDRAEYWLQSLIEPKLSPYKGRVVYLHNEEITTVELLHGYVNGVEVERLVQLNGDKINEVAKVGHHLFRRGSQESLTTISNESAGFQNAASTHLQVRKIIENYSVAVMKTARVAGRPCVVLKLIPKDGDRYERQFSVAEKSGHLLKYAIYNDNEELLEAMEFITLEPEVLSTTDEAAITASKAIEHELKNLANNFTSSMNKMLESKVGRSSGSPLPSPAVNEEPPLDLQPSWLPQGFLPTQLNSQLNQPLDAAFSAHQHRPKQHHPKQQRTYAKHYSDGLTSFTLFYQVDSVSTSNVSERNKSVASLPSKPAQHTQLLEGAMLMLSRRYPVREADRIRADGVSGKLGVGQLSLIGEIPLPTAERILNSIK